MKKIICWLLALSIAFIYPALLTAQERRVALVIGNGDYQAATKLINPVNDAADIGEVLAGLGFDVEVRIDADLDTMEKAVLRFGNKLAGSTDSVGFFYYAGHGVQSNGENYFIPVDARLSAESMLRIRAIPLQFVLDSIGEAGNKLNIIVLDACRDNPFSWARSSARGLAVVGIQPAASIVVYSTSAGKVAQDGTGRNGTFTEELLRHLPTPGLDIMEVLRRTGQDVQAKTASAQIPAIYSQFFGFLQLVPGEAPAMAGPAAPMETSAKASPAAGSVTSAGSSSGSSSESSGVLDYLPAFFDEAPANSKLTIAKAEELTWDGQWLSAWKILEITDPNNRDPYMLAKKIRTMLDGNTSLDLFQGFSIANMPPDGDWEAACEAGTLDEDYFDFDPHSAVQALLKRDVKVPPVLAAALGDFYYSAYYDYDDSSFLSLDEIRDNALHWYDIANENFVLVELESIMHYAELLMDAGRADEAVSILEDETEWEPEDIELRLKLIDAYIATGKNSGAFSELDRLIEMTPSNEDAREFYHRAFELALKIQDQQALNRYLAAFEKKYPNDWLAGLVRHRVAVQTGNYMAAQTIADGLMKQFPLNTELLEGLLSNWLDYLNYNSTIAEAGLAFLDRWVVASQWNPVALGTYCLYRSLYRYIIVQSWPSSYMKNIAIQNALTDLNVAEMNLSVARNTLSEEGKALLDMIPDFRNELQAAMGY
ncbi:MAG: tetratricopeptide repeat protein [Treponema sp.]|nr:tetratricopeptide repeat protein [Treponema sp.]